MLISLVKSDYTFISDRSCDLTLLIDYGYEIELTFSSYCSIVKEMVFLAKEHPYMPCYV